MDEPTNRVMVMFFVQLLRQVELVYECLTGDLATRYALRIAMATVKVDGGFIDPDTAERITQDMGRLAAVMLRMGDLRDSTRGGLETIKAGAAVPNITTAF